MQEVSGSIPLSSTKFPMKFDTKKRSEALFVVAIVMAARFP